jgi:hypothetical protein
LGFSRISLSIGQTKDTDTHRELREGELRQTVFESWERERERERVFGVFVGNLFVVWKNCGV